LERLTPFLFNEQLVPLEDDLLEEIANIVEEFRQGGKRRRGRRYRATAVPTPGPVCPWG